MTFRGSSKLEKVSEGVLGALRGARNFFFSPPRGPKEASECPRGLPRTILSDFENVKNLLVFILFSAMGRPLGRAWRPWSKLLAAQEALFTCLKNLNSLSEASSGPLRRSAVFSEGSLGGPRGPKWSLGAILRGCRELPKSSQPFFSSSMIVRDHFWWPWRA